MTTHQLAIERVSSYLVGVFQDLAAVKYVRPGRTTPISDFDSEGCLSEDSFPVCIRVIVRLSDANPRTLHRYNQTVIELGLDETPTPVREHGDSESTMVFRLEQEFDEDDLLAFAETLPDRKQ